MANDLHTYLANLVAERIDPNKLMKLRREFDGVLQLLAPVRKFAPRIYIGTYPIYDFTSSGITSTWHFATPNKNRIEGPVMDNHFGLMTINWNPGQTTIKMECIDVHNNQRFEYNIPLNSIQPGLE